MRAFTDIDLRCDPLARSYVKNEIVDVRFAPGAGEIISRVGPNCYEKGDALITGSTGDNWSVTRARFELKYEPVAPTRMGEDGRYKACPVPVLARQVDEDFTAARTEGGDKLSGKAGDWLLQYAPGDFGLAENSRFVAVYCRCAPPSEGGTGILSGKSDKE